MGDPELAVEILSLVRLSHLSIGALLFRANEEQLIATLSENQRQLYSFGFGYADASSIMPVITLFHAWGNLRSLELSKIDLSEVKMQGEAVFRLANLTLASCSVDPETLAWFVGGRCDMLESLRLHDICLNVNVDTRGLFLELFEKMRFLHTLEIHPVSRDTYAQILGNAASLKRYASYGDLEKGAVFGLYGLIENALGKLGRLRKLSLGPHPVLMPRHMVTAEVGQVGFAETLSPGWLGLDSVRGIHDLCLFDGLGWYSGIGEHLRFGSLPHLRRLTLCGPYRSDPRVQALAGVCSGANIDFEVRRLFVR